MQILSLTFVTEASVPRRNEREQRKVSKPKAQGPTTEEIAARPWDEAFARSISQEPEHIPIMFDPAVGSEWQKNLL